MKPFHRSTLVAILLSLSAVGRSTPAAYAAGAACLQTEDAQAADGAAPSFSSQVSEVLRRATDGHTPTPEEIASVTNIEPAPDLAAVRALLPPLVKALTSTDGPVRTFALTVLAALQTPPLKPETDVATVAAPVAEPNAAPAANAVPTAAADAVAAPTGPLTYRPEIAKLLAPSVMQIAAHLTEESQQNRLLAATILGGFSPDPPAAIYAPLLAFLRRDDAIGVVGQAVVSDLLQLGPLNNEGAAAISRYLQRSDQTSETRSNLVDAIASRALQNQVVDKALLGYLDSDDLSLRARVILSLPQLDLSPEVFADTKSRVAAIAEGGQDSLQVVNAAKAVAPCWTATHMTSGCPVYQ